jgi:hypothetical protein
LQTSWVIDCELLHNLGFYHNIQTYAALRIENKTGIFNNHSIKAYFPRFPLIGADFKSTADGSVIKEKLPWYGDDIKKNLRSQPAL